MEDPGVEKPQQAGHEQDAKARGRNDDDQALAILLLAFGQPAVNIRVERVLQLLGIADQLAYGLANLVTLQERLRLAIELYARLEAGQGAAAHFEALVDGVAQARFRDALVRVAALAARLREGVPIPVVCLLDIAELAPD